MKEEIIIAGHGGQGVVLAGNIIANAAMEENLETCAMVSYGVEMRGGTANSRVIVSDQKIGSPVIVNPTIAIIMSEASLEKFEEKVKKDGLIILNSVLIKKDIKRNDVKIMKIPATEIANKLGNEKVANLVMLGVLTKKTNLLNKENMEKSIEKIFSEKNELADINKKAFNEGLSFKGD